MSGSGDENNNQESVSESRLEAALDVETSIENEDLKVDNDTADTNDNQESTNGSANNNNDDDSDDFDEFEEFEEFEEGVEAEEPQAEVEPSELQEQRHNSGDNTFNVESLRLESSLIEFEDENIDECEKKIDSIIVSIFNGKTGNKENYQPKKKLELDDRCQSIYSKMVQEPSNLKMVNWKKSIIRRQLLVELGIPIDLNEVSETNIKSKNNQLGVYSNDEFNKELNNNNSKEILKSIPDIKSLPQDIIEMKDEIIKNTYSDLNEMYKQLQPVSYYKSILSELKSGNEELHVTENDLKLKLEKMETVKEKLLQLSAVWDLNHSDISKDRDIFSSYVENLVGNTQKLRNRK